MSFDTCQFHKRSPYTGRSSSWRCYCSTGHLNRSSHHRDPNPVHLHQPNNRTCPSPMHINLLQPANRPLHQHHLRQQRNRHNQLPRLRRPPCPSLHCPQRRQRKSPISIPHKLHAHETHTNAPSQPCQSSTTRTEPCTTRTMCGFPDPTTASGSFVTSVTSALSTGA